MFTELIPQGVTVKHNDRISITVEEEDFWFIYPTICYDYLIRVMFTFILNFSLEQFSINLSCFSEYFWMAFISQDYFKNMLINMLHKLRFWGTVYHDHVRLKFSVELGFIFWFQNVEICLIKYCLHRHKFPRILNLK